MLCFRIEQKQQLGSFPMQPATFDDPDDRFHLETFLIRNPKRTSEAPQSAKRFSLARGVQSLHLNVQRKGISDGRQNLLLVRAKFCAHSPFVCQFGQVLSPHTCRWLAAYLAFGKLKFFPHFLRERQLLPDRWRTGCQ